MKKNYPQHPHFDALLGVPIHRVGVEEVHDFMGQVIDGGQKASVLNVNIHALNLAAEHSWFADILKQAAMVFCDGEGVLWGMKLAGIKQLPEKITYDRWMWQLGDFCQEKGYKLYFLGSQPGIAELAKQKMLERYPKIRIVGTHHGYFEKSGPESEAVIDEINRCQPDILIVGFGMPIQEKWIHDYYDKLDVAVFLAGGAAFQCVSGTLKSPPAWMVRWHLEWFYRLYQQPIRRFHRYIIGIPLFFMRILIHKWMRTP